MAGAAHTDAEAGRSPRSRPKLIGGTLALDRYHLGILLFLVAAGASFLLSIGLWFAGNRDEGLFVGLWVPSILAAAAFWVSAVTRPS